MSSLDSESRRKGYGVTKMKSHIVSNDSRQSLMPPRTSASISVIDIDEVEKNPVSYKLRHQATADPGLLIQHNHKGLRGQGNHHKEARRMTVLNPVNPFPLKMKEMKLHTVNSKNESGSEKSSYSVLKLDQCPEPAHCENDHSRFWL